MDRLTKTERSALMSRIRGDGLKPEASLERELRRLGVRFERNSPELPGRPDFVFKRAKLAVFVHGCFWHKCPRHCRIPKTRRSFWLRKFDGNKRRDERQRRKLRAMGWRTKVVWEHSLGKTIGEQATSIFRRIRHCR
jgi:DNA mismatch endonuclease, patch repair protein